MFKETEGNPFFVEEVYQHLSEEGKLFDESGAWKSDLRVGTIEVPEGVRLVIGRRLDRLGEKARKVLTAAAVIGRTFPLDLPFMVLATQNPVEHHGTYPLPESQLDRFMMKIEIGYPNAEAEKEILHKYTNGNYHQTIQPVLVPADVLYLQDESRKVHINAKIVDYMIQLVQRTRNHPEIELGISPRGTVSLFRASQALAMVDGRKFVLPDDVKRAATPVFGHRLALARHGSKGSRSKEEVLEGILSEIKVPD